MNPVRRFGDFPDANYADVDARRPDPTMAQIGETADGQPTLRVTPGSGDAVTLTAALYDGPPPDEVAQRRLRTLEAQLNPRPQHGTPARQPESLVKSVLFAGRELNFALDALRRLSERTRGTTESPGADAAELYARLVAESEAQNIDFPVSPQTPPQQPGS